MTATRITAKAACKVTQPRPRPRSTREVTQPRPQPHSTHMYTDEVARMPGTGPPKATCGVLGSKASLSSSPNTCTHPDAPPPSRYLRCGW